MITISQFSGLLATVLLLASTGVADEGVKDSASFTNTPLRVGITKDVNAPDATSQKLAFVDALPAITSGVLFGERTIDHPGIRPVLAHPWRSPDSSLFAKDAGTVREESWTLKYKFQTGQKFRYETHQTMTLDAQIAGQERRIDVSELIQRRLFTVISVEPAGDARLAMQFEYVWMKKKIDDREHVEFNSTMKLSDVPAAFRLVAHDLKGVAPKYWLSPQGESLYPKPADVIKPKPSAGDGTARTPSPKPLVEGQSSESGITLISGTTSTADNKQKAELDPGTFLMPLPNHPVKVGDSWKETVTIPVRLTAEISRKVPILRTYRLQSVENGIANISFGSSIDTPVKGATVRAQLIQATPQGAITFDIEKGVMLGREMRYNESVVGATGRNDLLSSVGLNTEVLLEPSTAAPSP